MTQTHFEMKTSLGKIYLVASDKGLQSVLFQKQSKSTVIKLDLAKKSDRILQAAAVQIKEYLSGERKKFNLKFDISGTVFQQKVWKELSKIPFGQTVSYKEVAKRIKNPRAIRAVGTANGRNPICIIVPCHRVIAADGTLGGYSGGIEFKKKLLAIEEIKI